MHFLTINYMVSRTVREPHKRKRVETRNGKLRLKGDWNDDATHQKIRRRIIDRNPGWMVGAYTPAPHVVQVSGGQAYRMLPTVTRRQTGFTSPQTKAA